MCKWVGTCLLVGSLFFSGQVLAKDVSFGPKDTLYSLTIPEKWTESTYSNGVQLTSEDKKSSLAVTILPKEGISVSTILQMLPSKLGLTEVKKEDVKVAEEEKPKGKKGKEKVAHKPKFEHSVVRGLLGGVPLRIELKEEKNCLVSIVSAGDDEVIHSCLATLTTVAATQVGNENK